MTDGRNDLSFALLADGTSDRALLRILTWCLRQLDSNVRLPTPHFERRGSEDIEQSVCRLLESYRPHCSSCTVMPKGSSGQNAGERSPCSNSWCLSFRCG